MALILLASLAASASAQKHTGQEILGFRGVARHSGASKASAQRLAALPGRLTSCIANGNAALQVAANILAELPGKETAVASMADGLAVFTEGGDLVARAPRGSTFICSGLSASVVSISAGQLVADADAELVVITTEGVPNATSRTLTIFKRRGAQLVGIFSGKIEDTRAKKPGMVEYKDDGTLRFRSPWEEQPTTLYWNPSAYRFTPEKPTIPRVWFTRLLTRWSLERGKAIQYAVDDGKLEVGDCVVSAIRPSSGRALCRDTSPSKTIPFAVKIDSNLNLSFGSFSCDPRQEFPPPLYKTKSDCEYTPLDEDHFILFRKAKEPVEFRITPIEKPETSILALELAESANMHPELDSSDFHRIHRVSESADILAAIPLNRVAVGDGKSVRVCKMERSLPLIGSCSPFFTSYERASPSDAWAPPPERNPFDAFKPQGQSNPSSTNPKETLFVRGVHGTQNLLAVSYSTHDEMAACPNGDAAGLVQIYRSARLTRKIEFSGSNQRLPFGMITPDERYIIAKGGCSSGLSDCGCRQDWAPFNLYDIDTGRIVNTYEPKEHRFGRNIVASTVTPTRFLFADKDGRLLALTHDLKIAELYRLSSGGLEAFAVSPDGTGIAIASSISNEIQVLRFSDGAFDESHLKGRTNLKGHETSIKGLAFSPDGGYLVSRSLDGWLRIWDTHGERGEIWSDRESGKGGNVVWNKDDILFATDGLSKILVGPDLRARNIAEHPWLDWTAHPETAAPRAKVAFDWNDALASFVLRVSNEGHGPLSRLAAIVTNNDGKLLALALVGYVGAQKEEMVLIRPQQFHLPLKPKGDTLRVFFKEGNGAALAPLSVNVTPEQFPTVQVDVSHTIDDNGSGTSSGNGNGRADPGEAIDVVLKLKNSGRLGLSRGTLIVDDGGSCPNLRIYGNKRRQIDLPVAAEAKERINLGVPPTPQKQACKLMVMVLDENSDTALSSSIDIPVGE